MHPGHRDMTGRFGTVIFMFFFIFVGTGICQDRVPIKSLQKPAQLQKSGAPGGIRPSPETVLKELIYKRTGRIDRMGKDNIVIDDSQFLLGQYTHYYSETGIRLQKSRFREGKMVGFELKGGARIKNLWLLE